ncbi:uncharacterized protein F4807DRAFT_456013 [Annulohypoxylon truncatum]|uniref:uncharacterized protein n=1 Tax=Annulohypoxylon truncatum TaxID=327061 RepID=UPI002007A09B|nr:uncharacterized protein F4807DRAFT_456013 [Annulohypoxylon truncatum]KAI1214375.1 hypothetical protein F4807DRAFT_456013 [Annulohypoxylon truncatum]
MRELWSCSSCVGFMVLALLAAPGTIATNDDYQIHKWEKNYDLLRHPKREASCQQSGYYLCSASVNGGCCPEGYACAVSSCYATTGGPTSACGQDGYYNCPLTAGPGGCCPTGYICNDTGCQAPATLSVSETCRASFFACTASPYGCCPNGMTCGSYTCYGPPSTYTVSEAVTTTDSKGSTITTEVTTITVITPSASATSATAVGTPKLVASTVSKLPSIETDTSTSSGGGGGLSSSQIGGIIGGAVALLVVIVLIAGIVIWQLKRTEKATKAAVESKQESSSDQPRSQKSLFGKTTISEVDGMDADSVARARNAHLRSLSDDSTVGGRSPAQTPNLYGSNASTTPPVWQGYFTRLPPSDSSDGRESSMDSYARHDNGGFPQRGSVDSQGPHGHARHVSNASELDGNANSISELGANDASDTHESGRQRSSSITKTPITHVRRGSDPSSSSRGARDNSDTTIGNPLGTLSEENELHGYYGSPDFVVGQTAAKLYQKNASASSLGTKAE